MQAKDIMRKDLVTVAPEMTLRETAQLFVEKGITGAPVLDGWELVGVISQTDLVRREGVRSSAAELPGYYREGEKAQYLTGFQIEDPDMTRVRDVMTPAAVSVEETASVEELARIMVEKHIHRILVRRRGRLCGIVSTMDLLRVLLARREEPARW